jgi:DUF1680 family protein
LLRVLREGKYGDSMERVMYNTVLGAKPLQPDGRTFYYSDYNFKARKVYSDRRWACCSGTLPQVAADYGINAYLRDSRGLFVNLYIPSTVRWTQEGTAISLRQKSSYPFESNIEFAVTVPWPTEFTLNLRIPAWAEGASIVINGKRAAVEVIPGSFANIRRQWKSGDRIELDLPLTKRLEAIASRHPNIVALLCGPLVLFPVGDAAPAVSRAEFLSAGKVGERNWQVKTSAGPLKLLPFTSISDESYATYLDVS